MPLWTTALEPAPSAAEKAVSTIAKMHTSVLRDNIADEKTAEEMENVWWRRENREAAKWHNGPKDSGKWLSRGRWEGWLAYHIIPNTAAQAIIYRWAGALSFCPVSTKPSLFLDQPGIDR